MVRLVKHDRPGARNYLSRREQWRLLLLILPLGLVIIVMGKLRDPNFARKVNNAFANAPAVSEAPVTGDEKVAGQVAPGSFRSETSKPSQPAPPVVNAPEVRTGPPPAAGLFPGVQAEWLKSIKDNSYFRNAEKEAWFHFFEIVQRTPEKEIEAAHKIEASYVQLVDQPGFYRGKLLTVYGDVRQVTEQTPAPNDLGIKSYYRIVVQPGDGSNWPIFVYCLELPADLSVGEHAGGYVSVRGLFFKKLSYPWKEGVGIAPVIVAKSITYDPGDPCGPGASEIHPPTTSDTWNSSEPNTKVQVPAATEPSTSFEEILTLAGWDVERLAKLDNGVPLSDADRVEALELLRRLRSFGAASLDEWVHDGLEMYDMLTKPSDYRGQLVRLAGHVTKVTPLKPDASVAERLEMPQYFECEVVLDKGIGPTTVLTVRVPKAWLQANKLDEPVTAVALYFKRVAGGDPPSALWLAKEIAWHPGKPAGSGGPLWVLL